MPDKLIHLEPDEFAEFLRNELPPAQHSDVEQHLSVCETCQCRLEQTVAESKWWDDAQQFLSNDEIDYEYSQMDSHIVDQPVNTDKSRGDVRQIVAWLDPTDDPRMLGRLAGYEIAGVVGCGGMGVVLKGLDTALNRYVAIKILAPHLASSGAARKRFAREAQAAAAVVHDNVIAIHGVAETNGLPYLVMPYVRGISVQKRIDMNGPLSVSEVLRIGMQTAAGLAAAHAQGLVHRDIKPANILLDGTTERVLLTDFGLARAADDASVTQSGIIPGTPHFMSPEQAQGEGIDYHSDLFSLGGVLFAMCVGRPPFRAETTWGIIKKVCESSPPSISELNADIPIWLSRIVEKLLEKKPADRFKSASEVHDLLESSLAHIHDPTGHLLPAQCNRPTRKEKKRQTQLRALFGGAFAAAVLFVAWIVLKPLVSNRENFNQTNDSSTNPSEVSHHTANSSTDNADDAQLNTEPTTNPISILPWDDGTDAILESINNSVLELEQD